MPELYGHLTPQGVLNGNLQTIVYANNYNGLINKPSINSVELQGNKTAADLGLLTAGDIPVDSVNGKQGVVILDGDDIEYEAGTSVNSKITALEAEISSGPVISVNGQQGVVELDGTDINYSLSKTLNQKIDEVEASIPVVSYPVTSVNSKTGAVVLDDTDIEHSSGVSVNSLINTIMNYTPVYGNTASGAIATFDTSLALPLQDCTIEINGTNLTGANVAVKGANLFSLTEDTVREDRQGALSACTKTDTSVTATSTANSYACFGRFLFLPKGNYCIKYQATSSDSYSPSVSLYNGATLIKQSIALNTATTFTLSEDMILEVRMFVTSRNDATVRTVTFSDIQIEEGDSVSETYIPYVSNTTTISWDGLGTVSEGSLNVTTGKLTVVNGSMGAGDYQITPIPINQISGTNNIFTDTNGNTSVMYACSLKDYIDSQ